ncbi:MAG: VanZ family protein [bacterium]
MHQGFVPTRNASLYDVFIDVLGVILAVIIIIKIPRLREKIIP